MRKILLLAASVVFLCLVVMSGCSSKSSQTLYLYNWSDYIDEDLVEAFTEESGIEVITDYFDSNESMYAKLRSGAVGYDIAFPTSYMVEIMKDSKMLQEIDHVKLSNLGNIDRKFAEMSEDSDMRYSVPYMVSTTGIGLLSGEHVSSKALSWDIFGNPDYAGKMTMLNDVRETIGAALKYLGYSYNSTSERELEEAKEVLISWKRNLAKFENDQYKNGLVSGEFIISQGYSGDILQVQEEREDLIFVIPEEGTSVSIDNMVILKDSKNSDAAHAFIDYMLRAEVAAANTEYVYYLAPNIEAYELMSEEILNNPAVFLSDETIENSEILLDLGEKNSLYNRIWDELKSSR